MKTACCQAVLTAVVICLIQASPAACETVVLDAEKAARLAIDASTLTAAAAERVEASTSEARAADAARLPVLSLSANAAYRNEVPEFAAPVDGPGQPPVVIFPNIQQTWSADLQVSQPIYSGGAITAGRDAASSHESASTWAERLTEIDLANHARMFYWAAVAASANVSVAEAQLRRTQRLLDDARALREAGMAVNADVYAAEARNSGAEVSLIKSRNDEALAHEQLRSLLGIPASASLAFADMENEQVPSVPAPLAELQRLALENRPELKITDAQIDGLDARARSVRSSLKPQVAATGSWRVAKPNERFLPLEDEINDSWRVAALASWRFYDGSQTRSKVAAVHAEQRALEHDRGELERLILLEVASARLELESARKAVVAADASAEAADAWEQASSERYAAGLAMLSELLDAQADLTTAEVAQVQSRATAWMAEAALRRAVGR